MPGGYSEGRWDNLPLSSDVKRYIEAANRATVEQRALMLQFAAIICTCQPWYNHRDPGPAQLGCMIHTTMLIDPKGEWLD